MARRLYKYLPQAYARAFVVKGEIRVGTLHEYRDEEAHGSQIGDSQEGVRVEWTHDQEPKAGPDLNELERRAIVCAGPGITVQGVRIEKRHVGPNLYLLCLSEVRDQAVMRRMSPDYDSCVEIHDPKGLVASVSKCLEGFARLVGVFRCAYMDRSQHYTMTGHHPALIKDPGYAYQREVRALWKPEASGGIKARIIQVPEASECCHLVELDRGSQTGLTTPDDSSLY